MSRHRGAKPCRRYELLGRISLLSLAYLLSVERWQFHIQPPDHLDVLSYLLDVCVSQLSWLISIYSTPDCQPGCGNLRIAPLLFGRLSPQLNYPAASFPCSCERAK